MSSIILITGGAGFLGSHLADAFIQQGDKVIVVDNLLSSSGENIKHLKSNQNFQFIQQDVTKPLHLNQSISAIYHFASPASPNPKSKLSYMAHPIKTLMANSLGTQNMLELATQNNCPIVLASTSEVYGNPDVHPQTEDYNGNVSPNGPRSCYDEGKRYLEAIAFAYHRKYQTKIKVIRIFNTYGPRMILDEGRLIPALVNSALNGTIFYQHGNGLASRSFCYVDDLIKGILAVGQSDQAIGEVINLGNPEEYTIIETIKVMETVIQRQLNIEVIQPALDDPKRRRPDITKAKNLLNWKAETPLRQGLELMLKSYEVKKS